MHLPRTLALAALTSSSLALTIGKRDNQPAEGCTDWVTVTSTVTASGSPTGAAQPPVQDDAAIPGTVDNESNARVDNSDGQSGDNSASPSEGSGNDTQGGGGDYSPPDNKRGFAYNDANLVNSLLKSGAKGSWAYNWDSNDNGLDSSVEFVPMLWSNGDDHTSRWDDNVKEMLAKGAQNLLSFNEPDHAEQAKIDPQTAAAAHAKYMNPYGDKARIGSPAITNSDKSGEGTEWLEKFIPACEAEGCQIDFCVAHWYAPADAEQSLKDHLDKVHEICGEHRPVWLTEFAPDGDEGASVKFIGSALELMDDIEWVERYSYFMVGGEGKLTGSDGGLSPEGEAYFEGQ